MSARSQLMLVSICLLYVTVKVARGLLQRHHAARFARRSVLNSAGAGRSGRPWPAVDILVPCYNEDPDLLDECLTSLVKQDYPGRRQVFVVDDGSGNRAALLPVLNRHQELSGVSVTLLDQNLGKRRALNEIMWRGDGDLVVTVDSDTALDPDVVSRIVLAFTDERVGGVSVAIRALNVTSRLPQLIDQNYRLLVDQERAAQSRFQTVLCCWGGCAAYRRVALKEVWQEHLNQIVAKRVCTTGDDLHLTLELLISDYDTVLEPAAVARTHVPDTLRGFARQQLRWSRSFVRELPWAWRAVAGRPAYLRFDLVVQAVSPVLLAAAILVCLVEGVAVGPAALARGLLLVAATVVTTSIGATLRARDPRYLLHGAVYHTLVIPGFFLALATFGRDSWKTRKLRDRTPPAETDRVSA